MFNARQILPPIGLIACLFIQTIPASAAPRAYVENQQITVPRAINKRVREFIAFNRGTVEFADKVPFAVQPIHSYGVDGVAYYEIWLTRDGRTPEGWLLMSATDDDFPLVNFSHNGTPYSKKLTARLRNEGRTLKSTDRIYRFGVSYFALENASGALIADQGKMPHWLPKPGTEGTGSAEGNSDDGLLFSEEFDVDEMKGIHYDAIQTYDDLRILWAESYFTPERARLSEDMRIRIFPEDGHGEAYQSAGDDAYIYRWIDYSSNQCLYTQIPKNYRYNWANCWSGCNNNAWTSLFGWWDKNLGKSNLIQTTSLGESCPTFRNTTSSEDVVDPVQMWFRGTCSTYCGSGTGWTKWKRAYKGYKFAYNQGYGYSYKYRWCNSVGCHSDLANILIDSIGNNYRPAHVGANSHFWVGTGIAQWDSNTDWTWVYCYPGWSQDHSDDVWIWWHDLNTSTKVFVY